MNAECLYCYNTNSKTMKEYLIKIPDDSQYVVTAVMERFGVKASEVKKKKTTGRKVL